MGSHETAITIPGGSVIVEKPDTLHTVSGACQRSAAAFVAVASLRTIARHPSNRFSNLLEFEQLTARFKLSNQAALQGSVFVTNARP